jgi:hypothetical protein
MTGMIQRGKRTWMNPSGLPAACGWISLGVGDSPGQSPKSA